MDFYNLLGDRFIAAGDYNATHTHWGSRLVTPKGRQLYNAIIKPNNKLDCFPWQPHILANRPQESSRPNRPSSDKHSPQYNKRQTAFGPVARPYLSLSDKRNQGAVKSNYLTTVAVASQVHPLDELIARVTSWIKLVHIVVYVKRIIQPQELLNLER